MGWKCSITAFPEQFIMLLFLIPFNAFLAISKNELADRFMIPVVIICNINILVLHKTPPHTPKLSRGIHTEESWKIWEMWTSASHLAVHFFTMSWYWPRRSHLVVLSPLQQFLFRAFGYIGAYAYALAPEILLKTTHPVAQRTVTKHQRQKNNFELTDTCAMDKEFWPCNNCSKSTEIILKRIKM